MIQAWYDLHFWQIYENMRDIEASCDALIKLLMSSQVKCICKEINKSFIRIEIESVKLLKQSLFAWESRQNESLMQFSSETVNRKSLEMFSADKNYIEVRINNGHGSGLILYTKKGR